MSLEPRQGHRVRRRPTPKRTAARLGRIGERSLGRDVERRADAGTRRLSDRPAFWLGGRVHGDIAAHLRLADASAVQVPVGNLVDARLPGLHPDGAPRRRQPRGSAPVRVSITAEDHPPAAVGLGQIGLDTAREASAVSGLRIATEELGRHDSLPLEPSPLPGSRQRGPPRHGEDRRNAPRSPLGSSARCPVARGSPRSTCQAQARASRRPGARPRRMSPRSPAQ